MIVSRAFAGKRYAVLGLARSGVAAAEALLASGAHVTAWDRRDANWSMVIAGVAADPADAEKATTWAREFWEALHPHSAGAAYVNFMMEEGESRVKATYGENHDRLREIKAKYDPDNFFHVNQNIEPAGAGAAGG